MKLAYGPVQDTSDDVLTGLASDPVVGGIDLDADALTITVELADETLLELRFDRASVDARVLALLDDAKAAAA